jgi:hypothetical protein
MRPTPFAAAVVALLSCLTLPASAHRLDEYLLDTTFSIHPDRVEAEMRLTPGVNVAGAVVADVDSDGDAALSDAEQQAYAGRVLRDVSLSLDGQPLQLRLISATYPAIEDAREGTGVILLRFDAPVPGGGGGGGGGPGRTLTFENHHQSRIAAYMVNSLVPTDAGLRITSQGRNYDQSFYRLEYACGAGQRSSLRPSATWSSLRLWLTLDTVALLALAAVWWRRRRGGVDEL